MRQIPRNWSILLVDDEPVIRETLCVILREEGYDVATAKTGEEAISLAQQRHFDAAIIDLKLPDLDGTLVLHQLKQQDPDVCVIMITAYPTTESAIAAVKEEAYEYITKPFDVGHVKLIIRRGVEEKQLQKEKRELLRRLQEEKDRLSTLLDISQLLSSILNLEELADCVVRRVAELLRVKSCSLMLVDAEDTLTVKAAIGMDKLVLATTRVKLGEAISGWVAKEGKPLLVQNIEDDALFGRANLPQYASKSLLCIPLKIKDRVIGVVNVTDRIDSAPQNEFQLPDLRFLTSVCNYASIAIENAQLYGEVRNLAITDGLTGLYNHRYFQTQLAAECVRVQRYPHPLSLIMFDIDYFKQFNDTYGHPMGDLVLREISGAIRQALRKVDIACRYGGEEFALILPETPLAEAVRVADKIRQSIEALDFETGQAQTRKRMTVSGGVAEFTVKMNRELLVSAADKALYRAKSSGKNRICQAPVPVAVPEKNLRCVHE